jgi:hypothetical protein
MMKWLETISIQVNDRHHQDVRKHLKDLACQLLDSGRYPDLISIEVYGHASLRGDHILSLIWHREHMPQSGSALGIQIRAIMQHYGLTDHTTWYAIQLNGAPGQKRKSI